MKTNILKPEELESERPYGPTQSRACDVWDALSAAAAGDAESLRRLFARDPNLCKAEYGYRQPIHFAVREGHLETVRVLLEEGADPGTPGPSGEDLASYARERGHDSVAKMLDEARARSNRIEPSDAANHPIHAAVAANDLERVREFLDADPELVHSANTAGATPLHSAVAASAREVAGLLLDRGADLHALHGAGPGSEDGYASVDFQPIDVALWTNPFWNLRGDTETARLLLVRGAARDLVIDAALGDLESVRRALREEPGRVAEARLNGKRALSAAIEFGHEPIARLLLECGADPNAPEGATAPKGAALYSAARSGSRSMVELLLAHGADPNCSIESSGSAAFIAKTGEIRSLLLAHGAELDAYDLTWLGEDDATDQDYRSTPLAWAARSDLPDMVELLLARGAPTSLADDEPWATPLAWADRRGHERVVELLRNAGA